MNGIVVIDCSRDSGTDLRCQSEEARFDPTNPVHREQSNPESLDDH
jgi:hypothetical protein